jgi:cyanophycinase-like exopeptidase
MRAFHLILLWASVPLGLQAQAYTTWTVGSATDVAPQPTGGICLMGGATENDSAMVWFLRRANGGDVLVLRASGSDGYNAYFHSELGVAINSVETIRFNNASAANDPYIHDRITKAEAIWFAGGDQWNYISYWRGTAIAGLISQAVVDRNVVIGGTSAGMAILGGAYFSAQVGSVTSAQALADPYHPFMTVDQEPFLDIPYLQDVITDTHYDNPDRCARHMAFLARAYADSTVVYKGIACNEYTAICIDGNGLARVFGEWPQYQEYAYFIQMNCERPLGAETCSPGMPLTWDRQGMAVKAYKVPGTWQGNNTFDVFGWRQGNGGDWEDWSIVQGVFSTTPGDPMPECLVGVPEQGAAVSQLLLDGAQSTWQVQGLAGAVNWRVLDPAGRVLMAQREQADAIRIPAQAHTLRILVVEGVDGRTVFKLPVR